jgi:hypothetical protein
VTERAGAGGGASDAYRGFNELVGIGFGFDWF